MKKPSTFLLLLLLLLFSKHARAQQQSAFQSEEITFKSVGDVSLSGTLTIPNGTGPYPAIVLLGGSERMNRVAM